MAKKLERKYILNTPVTSASDTLRETLSLYKIPQKEFADHIRISPAHLSDILNRKKYMTPSIALRIQKVTGISAKLLLTLDFKYKLENIEEEEELDSLPTYDWVNSKLSH